MTFRFSLKQFLIGAVAISVLLAAGVQLAIVQVNKRHKRSSIEAFVWLRYDNDVCFDPFNAVPDCPHVITLPGKSKHQIRNLVPALGSGP